MVPPPLPNGDLDCQKYCKAIRQIALLGLAIVALFDGPYAASAQSLSDLKLSGIFHRPSGTSSAVFILGDKTQKLVSQGRLIDAQTTLLGVEPNRVKIRRGDRVLWIDLIGGLNTQEQNEARPKEALASRYSGRDDTSSDAYRLRVIRLKSALKPQIGKDYISAGLLVADERILDLFNGTPLQAGDIVKRVNGTGFLGAEDMERFAYEWKKTHKYKVKVLRGGDLIELQP